MGAEAATSLGISFAPLAASGAMSGYVDDALVNYLFLGGPNSNVNRLASVLPLMTPLLRSMMSPAPDVDGMTRFLAVAGVSLKR